MLEAVGQDEAQALALLGDLGAEGEVREYAAILRTVGRPIFPLYIPGPGDAPFGKYLREAHNTEVVFLPCTGYTVPSPWLRAPVALRRDGGR